VKCKRCNREISNGEGYEYLGETLCEDCYIDIRYPVKACDPWAVYSATRSREALGLKGVEGLTELQTQMAILRHCELIKGTKEDGRIYLVPFD